MNKKEFKRYMQQGLGRCVLALKASEDIKRFKEIVLWGCLHNLSFDTQCEGTRAAYIYELTTYFNDEDYFVLPTVEAFDNITRHRYWLFSHFCELLRLFAENGNETAKNALDRKYSHYLSTLLKKRRFGGYDFERDNFEHVCLSLSSTDSKEVIIKIVSDMGYLFKQNPHYDCSDFSWFCSSIDDRIGKKRLNSILKRESEKDENVCCFYQNYLKLSEKFQTAVQKPVNIPDAEDVKSEVAASGKVSLYSKIRFSNSAEANEKIKLAKEAITEPNLDVKAELLATFTFDEESFPLSHKTVIEYSKLPHERLSKVAFDILTDCQSQDVREYAWELLADGKHKSNALKMLLRNYKPEDKQLLLTELYEIKVDYEDKSDWHSIGLKILDAYDKNVKLPKEFLIYIYNTTLCSCCREYAVRALAKRRWLTKDIIDECRYDSNYDLSKYINRYHSRY